MNNLNTLPFRFAFSSNAFVNFNIYQTIDEIKKAGYDGIEIMADIPHLYPAQINKNEISKISERLRKTDLEISNINTFMLKAIGDIWHPSWIEKDPKERKKRIEHTIKSLNMAAKLKCRSISTEPGGPIPAGTNRNKALSWFKEGIEKVLPLAKKLNIYLLIEPEPNLLIENSEEFLEFHRMINSEYLGLNFDIGHFYCVGEDPIDAFYKLKPFIRHIHLEDISASRKHKHLLPGKGDIPLKQILNIFIKENYSGWVTVELYPYIDNPGEIAKDALDYIKKLDLE
jgi:sugar phosphate isomerase/epimerase